MAARDTVIARKTRKAKSPARMSPARALRLALARAADAQFELALRVATVEEHVTDGADAAGRLGAPPAAGPADGAAPDSGDAGSGDARGDTSHRRDGSDSDGDVSAASGDNSTARSPEDDGGLTVALDGFGGMCGAARLDHGFVSALVEMQTMKCLRRSPGRQRPPTATDAALAAPLIDAALKAADATLVDEAPETPRLGLRYAGFVAEPHSLSLLLGTARYRVLTVTVAFGTGRRTGRLWLAVPLAAPEVGSGSEGGPGRGRPRPGANGAAVGNARPAAPRGAAATVEQTAMTAQVSLDAILGRVSLPLRELCTLTAGQQLPLEGGNLENVALTGADGEVVARGQLGRLRGWRALRLTPNTAGAGPRRMPAPGQALDNAGSAKVVAPRETAGTQAPGDDSGKPPMPTRAPSPRGDATSSVTQAVSAQD